MTKTNWKKEINCETWKNNKWPANLLMYILNIVWAEFNWSLNLLFDLMFEISFKIRGRIIEKCKFNKINLNFCCRFKPDFYPRPRHEHVAIRLLNKIKEITGFNCQKLRIAVWVRNILFLMRILLTCFWQKISIFSNQFALLLQIPPLQLPLL